MFPKKGSDSSVSSAEEEQTRYFGSQRQKGQLPLCEGKRNIQYISLLLSFVTKRYILKLNVKWRPSCDCRPVNIITFWPMTTQQWLLHCEEENTHFEVTSGKSPLITWPKWWFLSVSCTLWIQICVTPVDQETSGPGLITMLNACPHTSPTPHCSLPPKSRPLPFASPFVYLLTESDILCSDCIKCDCFICSGATHRLIPALCLSVHQFIGIPWINTSPQQSDQQDLNDFLQYLLQE